MDLRYRPQFARLPLLGLALCAQLVGPAHLHGQERPNVTVIVDDDGMRHDFARLRNRGESRFRLFGEADRAFADMRALENMEYFVTNTGIIDAADGAWDSQPDLSGCALCAGGVIGQWFDVSPIYAAPRSDWERFIEQVPSLLEARGQGYSVAYNAPTVGLREILAADDQRGVLFSGALTTTDGTCQDFLGPNRSY